MFCARKRKAASLSDSDIFSYYRIRKKQQTRNKTKKTQRQTKKNLQKT